MLELPITEQELTYRRGLAASTFISQPFWKDMQEYMGQQVADAMNALTDAKFADDNVKARRLDKFVLIKELVARIEQFPLAAIDAARESGDINE